MELQPGDVVESLSDINKSKNKLGYKPLVSINEGIPLFIDWYYVFIFNKIILLFLRYCYCKNKLK